MNSNKILQSLFFAAVYLFPIIMAVKPGGKAGKADFRPVHFKNPQLENSEYDRSSSSPSVAHQEEEGPTDEEIKENMEKKRITNTIMEDINEFSIKLFTKALAVNGNHKNGNISISPFSIHVVLYQASIGASSYSTAFNEINEIIKINGNGAIYKEILKKLMDGNENLKLVSGIFVDSSFVIKQNFVTDSPDSSYFDTLIKNLSFKSEPDVQRQYINNWFSTKTNNKINGLFTKDSINTNTELLLASAMHFQCSWKRQFQIARDSQFWNFGNTLVKVEMMYTLAAARYYYDKSLKYSAIQLYYGVRDYSMIIILPDDINGLKNLVESGQLSNIKMSDLLENMKSRWVHVHLPGFKIEETLNLQETLSGLKCSNMFKTDGKFSNINSDLKRVNTFMHKASIVVDKNGTGGEEYSEVLDSTLRGSIVMEGLELYFQADHPFIYYIIYNINKNSNMIITSNDIILFGGQITTIDPQPN